ncbi:MAG: hypothetical protein M0Q42_00490 [Xanthomonadales bacterium]|nr:hypothetical protein [Xanthomonadales bacterium]
MHDGIFDSLIRNAFDFLGRSIDDLQAHPKYSVINFYSAVELLLKARLLKEHWSLIVAKPDEADKAKFLRGDFKSVALDEANKRLAKIVGDGLTDDELKCFNGLRKERNQMVHFAHAALGDGDEARKEMERIVSDHAKGWLHLRRLLTGRWVKHFEEYAGSIGDMDYRMREQTKALEPKFLLLTDVIADAERAGCHFMECPSCRFNSFEVGKPVWVGVGKCLTCGFSSPVITLECVDEDCGRPILLTESRESCPVCNHDYDPEEVDSVLDEHKKIRETHYQDPGDFNRVDCGMCDGYETVVCLDTDEWFCTDCFDIEEHVGQCEWCSDYSTHMPQDTFLSGCGRCEGRLGHEKDD